MNIIGFFKSQDSVDKSVIDWFWTAYITTVLVPLLVLLFDANRTDLSRRLEGVLVREEQLDREGIPRVKLDEHQIQFGGRAQADKRAAEDIEQSWLSKKSGFIKQRVAERIPGVITDQAMVPASMSGGFSSPAMTIDELDIFAEKYEVNPLILALPAAYDSLVTRDFRDEIPVAFSDIDDEVAFLPSDDFCDDEIPFQSAEDFVQSVKQTRNSTNP